jgi:NDP-sugar pyrophosphorylase family protein
MYALILAGGRGERLRPLTDTIPKPMISVAGKPILFHQLKWLRSGGVTDVIFLVGHLSECIRDYFGDGSDIGIRISYSYEDTPLGRGGAIKRGLRLIPDEESVFVLNGDIICDHPPEDIVRHYKYMKENHGNHMATIMAVPLMSPYGLLNITEAGIVSAFEEKTRLPNWINGGVYIFDTEMRDLLPNVGDQETDTFPELSAQGRISAVKSDFFWRSIDSFKDLSEAQDHLGGIIP